MSNFKFDNKDNIIPYTPATESTGLEISTNYSHGNYLIHSAEPNMSDASSIDLNNAIKNLNTNNSQGGNSGKNN